MRKMNTADLFRGSRLITSIGLKEDILELTEKSKDFKSVNDLGYELIFRMFAKATTAETESRIYEFLAPPFEMTAEKIAELPLDELMKSFHEILDFPQLLAFFKRAVSLM